MVINVPMFQFGELNLLDYDNSLSQIASQWFILLGEKDSREQRNKIIGNGTETSNWDCYSIHPITIFSV